MNAAKEIQLQVDSGLLELVSVVGVARSRSTAISRALSYGAPDNPGLFVIEPFHCLNAVSAIHYMVLAVRELLKTECRSTLID